MRRIFTVMLTNYIRLGLDGVPMKLGYVTDELSEYDRDIENVRRTAEHHRHTEDLRLGLQCVLGQKSFDLEKFYRTDFPWSADELREALEYMYSKLYPNDPIPEGGPRHVVLAHCDWPAWNLTMPGSPDDPRAR